MRERPGRPRELRRRLSATAPLGLRSTARAPAGPQRAPPRAGRREAHTTRISRIRKSETASEGRRSSRKAEAPQRTTRRGRPRSQRAARPRGRSATAPGSQGVSRSIASTESRLGQTAFPRNISSTGRCRASSLAWPATLPSPAEARAALLQRCHRHERETPGEPDSGAFEQARPPRHEYDVGKEHERRRGRGLLREEGEHEQGGMGEEPPPRATVDEALQGEEPRQYQESDERVAAAGDPRHGLGERRVNHEHRRPGEGQLSGEAQPKGQEEEEGRRGQMQEDVRQVIAEGFLSRPLRIDHVAHGDERPVVARGAVRGEEGPAERGTGISERAHEARALDELDRVVRAREAEAERPSVERCREKRQHDEAKPEAPPSRRSGALRLLSPPHCALLPHPVPPSNRDGGRVYLCGVATGPPGALVALAGSP